MGGKLYSRKTNCFIGGALSFSKYLFILTLLFLCATGLLLTVVSILLMDAHEIQTFSSRLYQFSYDLSQTVIQAHYDLPYSDEPIRLFRGSMTRFLEQPMLRFSLLYDPGGAFKDLVRKIRTVVDHFLEGPEGPDPNDLIISYFDVRPSLDELIGRYRLVSETTLSRIVYAIFFSLGMLLALAILTVFLVFYPLIKDMQNLSENRRSWIVFKEFKSYKLKNRSVKRDE